MADTTYMESTLEKQAQKNGKHHTNGHNGAGKPVEAEIHRAAERAGIERAERYEIALAEAKLTFSLRELCGAVGYGVNPRSFVRDSFDEIANQIEAEGKACEDEAGRWSQLFSIAARARFAGMVADKLDGEAAE